MLEYTFINPLFSVENTNVCKNKRNLFNEMYFFSEYFSNLRRGGQGA